MKLVFLVAAGLVVGCGLSNTSEGASPQKQELTAPFLPSKETIRKLIVGEWIDFVGPNPGSTRITADAIWNSSCWSHYRILGVRAAKMRETAAYAVEIETTSAGGPQPCGHSKVPGFSLALVSADDVRSGDIESIDWMVCASKKEFYSALQSPDPRASNAVCGTFVSDRSVHR
jgi:hypothetical protein